jgi:hypothetical protein
MEMDGDVVLEGVLELVSRTGKSMCAIKLARVAFLGLLLAAGGTILAMRSFPGTRASFTDLVTRPIPRSVRNIKMDRCQISSLRDRWNGYREHAIILRFEIGRDDLLGIIEARGFTPVGGGSYMSEILAPIGDHWEIKLPDQVHYRAPSWFDLAKWCHPETYTLEEDDSMNMSILFYNEQLGCAHLIRWELDRE